MKHRKRNRRGPGAKPPTAPRVEHNRMNQTATAAQPDVAQLREANLPAAVFPGGRNPAYRIYYTPDLHARLWQHANESLAVEICGVLLGVWGRDEAGPFVNVTESIRGEAATSKFAEVTFTHETWAKINHEMDTRFSHLSIVGWYHTHPDFGIFLSDRDVFIQQHFFANPGNIAYVIDPVRKTEGTFTWQGGKPVLAPHYWIGDKIQLAGAPTCLAGAAGPAVPGGPSSKAQPAASSDRPVADHLAPLVRPLTQVLAYLALFLLGFLLAGRLADWDRLRTEQDAVARVALLLGVKPGLREALEALADGARRPVQGRGCPGQGAPESGRRGDDGNPARAVARGPFRPGGQPGPHRRAGGHLLPDARGNTAPDRVRGEPGRQQPQPVARSESPPGRQPGKTAAAAGQTGAGARRYSERNKRAPEGQTSPAEQGRQGDGEKVGTLYDPGPSAPRSRHDAE